MKLNIYKDVLPHAGVIVFFLVIVIIFFNPIFFENKSLSQQDIMQWRGGSKELRDYREKTGEEGLWTNSMFGGMPAYLINVQWGNQPIKFVHRLISVWLPHPVSIIFLSMLSFYILLLVFGSRWFIATAGAVSYGYSSFLIIGLATGHNSRIAAIAYLPLIIAGIHYAYTKNKWLGGSLTALALALQLRFNHLQITYYTLLIIVVYGLVMLWFSYREGTLQSFIKRSSLLIAAGLLGTATFFGQFWAVYEYSKHSIRGESELTAHKQAGSESGLDREYAFQYSSGIFEPLTLLIPNFFGGSTSDILAMDRESETFKSLSRAQDNQQANQLARFSRAYWGKQPNTAPYYAGAITVFLFVTGLFFTKRKIKTWLIIVAVMGIVLSWGKNFPTFNYFLFDHLPGYNKFRSVTFTILLTIFAINLLGFRGLEDLLSQKWSGESRRKLLMGLAITGGFCFLMVTGAGMLNYQGQYHEQLPRWFTNALQEDRESLLRSDAFRSLLFILTASILIFLVYTDRLKKSLFSPLIILLVFLDHWFVDRRFLDEENFERNIVRREFALTEADKLILQDEDPAYRVYFMPNPWNDARVSYYHHSIGGYHGAKIGRYQDLIENCIQDQHSQMITKLQNGDTDFSDLGVFNMLNTRYIMISTSRNGVIRNRSANGSAWLVNEVELVSSADEELSRTCEINTRETALVDKSKFDIEKTSFSGRGSIRLTHYGLKHLTYEAELEGESFIVFSEVYYPEGWKAFIDGEPADIIRANYILRALEVGPGSHSIEFKFEPKAYYIGTQVMSASSYIVVILLLVSLFWTLRKADLNLVSG